MRRLGGRKGFLFIVSFFTKQIAFEGVYRQQGVPTSGRLTLTVLKKCP